MVFNDQETISPLWQAWQQAELMVKNCGYESIYFNDIKASGDFVNRGFKTILITDTLEEAQNLKSKFEDELQSKKYIINEKGKRLRLLIKVSNALETVNLSITEVPVTATMTKADMPNYIKDHYDFVREIICKSEFGGVGGEELERKKREFEPVFQKLDAEEKESLELLDLLDDYDKKEYKVTFIKKGKSYRLTWYNPDDGRRHQESLGDIFIFAGKPKLGYRTLRKQRSDQSRLNSIIEFPFGAYVWRKNYLKSLLS